MALSTIKPEFSRPLALRDIGAAPHRVELTARPEERRELAHRFGLEDIPSLSGVVTLRWRNDEILVEGHIKAEVTQSCIVTLEPVKDVIDEDFTVVYAEQPDKAQEDEPPEDVYAEPRELVEPLEGDSIDLGELLAQQLSLGLNPYPRKEGVELEEVQSPPEKGAADEAEDESENPFAVLKQLKSND